MQIPTSQSIQLYNSQDIFIKPKRLQESINSDLSNVFNGNRGTKHEYDIEFEEEDMALPYRKQASSKKYMQERELDFIKEF
jgi:predicted component of type VI protein secretion system